MPASTRWASRLRTTIPQGGGALSIPTANTSTTPAPRSTTSDIQGAAGLLKYLEDRNEQFRKTLTTKLLGYALGRTVLPSDLSLMDRMVGEGGDAPFSQLVVDVVTSKQFRNRIGPRRWRPRQSHSQSR